MSSAVEWQADGTPFSPRYGDIYRSESGGLEQANHVFLQGCGLPQAWRSKRQWRILETGFGLGLNFLATWQAWRADPERPRRLHYVSIEAWPVDATDLLRSAADWPDLIPFAQELSRQWHGLLPGFHRLSFDKGRVLLTLCIGDVKPMLRELRFEADSIFLDGFSPELNPDMWDIHTLQSIARLCRRGARLATWCSAGEVKQGLRQCGFTVKRAAGLAPKRHRVTGEFNPAWEPKTRDPLPAPREPGRCVVIGAGLAGAAVAASLARRGWQVEVLDSGSTAACGASGLPAGILAPHVSPDDAMLSRLTRCGVRITLQQAEAVLEHGIDWAQTGVLERRMDGSTGLPASWPREGDEWTRAAGGDALAEAGLPRDDSALWHAQAGWIKPSSLVGAWLSQPDIKFRGGISVARVAQLGDTVQVLDRQGEVVASTDLVVIAAGPGTAALLSASSPALNPLPLQAIRGQVSMATLDDKGAAGLAIDIRHDRASVAAKVPVKVPVNGHGSFVPNVPAADGMFWLMGASYERDNATCETRDSDHAENLGKLRQLLPDVAQALEAQFTHGKVKAWTGVRCAASDRLPVVGPFNAAQPGIWICTAMGSRGLTFAALCAELLAAKLHGEPLPVPLRLWRAMAADRWISSDRPS
jgi:tRNA 5-methylaminomethyl-2-thiouridine biosynthesis bifunctional protein